MEFKYFGSIVQTDCKDERVIFDHLEKELKRLVKVVKPELAESGCSFSLSKAGCWVLKSDFSLFDQKLYVWLDADEQYSDRYDGSKILIESPDAIVGKTLVELAARSLSNHLSTAYECFDVPL